MTYGGTVCVYVTSDYNLLFYCPTRLTPTPSHPLDPPNRKFKTPRGIKRCPAGSGTLPNIMTTAQPLMILPPTNPITRTQLIPWFAFVPLPSSERGEKVPPPFHETPSLQLAVLGSEGTQNRPNGEGGGHVRLFFALVGWKSTIKTRTTSQHVINLTVHTPI